MRSKGEPCFKGVAAALTLMLTVGRAWETHRRRLDLLGLGQRPNHCFAFTGPVPDGLRDGLKIGFGPHEQQNAARRSVPWLRTTFSPLSAIPRCT
jgi:hypothetical protein